jgi:hypothetical protein
MLCDICNKQTKHMYIFRWHNGIIINEKHYCPYCLSKDRAPMTLKQIKLVGSAVKVLNTEPMPIASDSEYSIYAKE